MTEGSSTYATRETVAVARPKRRNRVLELIAVFKFFKASLLAMVWLGTHELLRRDIGDRARDWLSSFSFGAEPRFVRELLTWASGLSDRRIRDLGIVAALYAVLYTVEGVGLWLEKRWAEYLVVVITSAFIPLEVYEIARGVSGGKLLALAINVAVVWYLVVVLQRSRRSKARPE